MCFVIFSLVLLGRCRVSFGVERCFNTCSSAGQGMCDRSLCECGTNCIDCGVESCDDFCPDGFRKCGNDHGSWCCDRSSPYDQCGDDWLVCEKNLSKKTKQNILAILIATSVTIFVAIAAGILCCCCLCCPRCPGYYTSQQRVAIAQYAEAIEVTVLPTPIPSEDPHAASVS